MDDDFGAAQQVSEIAQEVGSEAVGGAKKIAQSISAQITGQKPAPQADTAALATMQKNDENFRKEGEAEVLAKIRAIKNAYGQSEFTAKRKKVVEQRQEQQVQGQSTQIATAKRVDAKAVAIAKMHGNAESRQNMGGE